MASSDRNQPARPDAQSGRRPRDRAQTEADLLSTALELLRRDGVLAGVNLQEVAAESGVNRGRIYQLYGTRQALLRAALADVLQRWKDEHPGHWDRDFPERRKAMLRAALAEPLIVQLEALLALDGDPELHPFPSLDETRAALARDHDTGVLPADADGEALHALTASAYLGYVIFREAFARDLGTTVETLDRRFLTVYDDLVDRLTRPPDS